eukprot:s2178_g5.t1
MAYILELLFGDLFADEFAGLPPPQGTCPGWHSWKLRLFVTAWPTSLSSSLATCLPMSSLGGCWALHAVPVVPQVTNCWLVLYTWLQHTDVDIPHYDKENWTWVKGAFHTVDRPYGPILDYVHHRIGSTHVAHHVCAAIPFYKARKATEALKEKFPDLYLYDPTPIHKALWRVASRCTAVQKAEGGEKGTYIFT